MDNVYLQVWKVVRTNIERIVKDQIFIRHLNHQILIKRFFIVHYLRNEFRAYYKN